MIVKYYWIIALISGILMGLGAEPWGIWILPWVALVPLWLTPMQNSRFGRLGPEIPIWLLLISTVSVLL